METNTHARDGFLPLYFTGEAGNICGSATRISSAVFLTRSYASRSITCKHERENILSACLLPMISTLFSSPAFVFALFPCHLFRVVEQIILPAQRRLSTLLILKSTVVDERFEREIFANKILRAF